MRILGSIEHPEWKITIFKMDNRLSVKLENGLYEQIYKFRSGEADTLEDVRSLLDEEFFQGVGEVFTRMHQERLSMQMRQIDRSGGEPFPEII